jgi:hypothetical protein
MQLTPGKHMLGKTFPKLSIKSISQYSDLEGAKLLIGKQYRQQVTCEGM